MNFVENNGKKIAAVLCVASTFPVVATVYAMETEPGWHGDRYVNEDATLAKGWQEIEGTSYYFTEDTGTVAEEEKTVAASVSAAVAEDFSETVAVAAQDAVNAQTAVEEIEEPAAVAEEVEEIEEVAAPVEDNEVVEVPVEDESEIWTEDETVVAPEVSEEIEEVVQPEETVVETPEVVAPEVQEPAEEPEVQEPEVTVPEIVAPEVEEPEYTAPEVQEPEAEEPEYTAPEVQEPEYTDTTVTNASLNESIVNAALGLVGVTDGEQCTTVATAALAGAGVDNAVVLWPDQYASVYGYYTDTPEAGNLIYYNNGGRGVDHIAVYIGNGMAVHGNYDGKTVIASVYINGGAPQFIQVVG
jgi:hypothetical protein